MGRSRCSIHLLQSRPQYVPLPRDLAWWQCGLLLPLHDARVLQGHAVLRQRVAADVSRSLLRRRRTQAMSTMKGTSYPWAPIQLMRVTPRWL